MKTSELTGAALDWAVAKCEGIKVLRCGAGSSQYLAYIKKRSAYLKWTPSTNWAQGGPIIERERLCVGYQHQCDPAYVPLLGPETICWSRTTAGGYLKYGPTPLIAAMRAFVASKLGDEVEVPEELCKS